MQEVSLVTHSFLVPDPRQLLVGILNQLFLQLLGKRQRRLTLPVTLGMPVDVIFFGYRFLDDHSQRCIQGW